jgi:hypothetical protein
LGLQWSRLIQSGLLTKLIEQGFAGVFAEAAGNELSFESLLF